MNSLAHRDLVPQFPSDIPTHPLKVIDYGLIVKKDLAEIDKFWTACKELGFFYIKNHGIDPNECFRIGGEVMSLPMDEKLKFEHEGAKGSSFGYKPPGANLTNANGAVDTVEWWNIAKDDILSYPDIACRTYASPINRNMDALKEHVSKSEIVARTLLEVLNDLLQLPHGLLSEHHSSTERSTCEMTIIRNPGSENPVQMTDEQLAIGAHTDFGSLSLLHNICGGLQVLVPGTSDWQYVRPLEGHIICNLGDTISIFSGGILRSNVHRVVPQPGEQAKWDRWTLVYFFRPHATCELKTLVDESPLIREAAASPNGLKIPPGYTAEEWFKRRTKYFRADNPQASDGWKHSRGTEHNETFQ